MSLHIILLSHVLYIIYKIIFLSLLNWSYKKNWDLYIRSSFSEDYIVYFLLEIFFYCDSLFFVYAN